MNIFYLHKNPKICAQYHCDKHVVKMILETAQILSTVHWMNNGEGPYKPTHKKHPCVIWANESKSNYLWLIDLGLELCEEYTYRYGKRHKSEAVIKKMKKKIPKIKDLGITKRPQAMPEEYRHPNAVTAYRRYYIKDKARIATWKIREIPKWFK